MTMPTTDDELRAYYRRWFSFTRWANQTVLTALQGMAAPPDRAVESLQHAIQGERTWLARLTEAPIPGPKTWGPYSLANCDDFAQAMEAGWDAYIDALTIEQLAAPITWHGPDGIDRHDSVGEGLQQMLLHSARYRGAATGVINAAGLSVPDVDFMHWRYGVELA